MPGSTPPTTQLDWLISDERGAPKAVLPAPRLTAASVKHLQAELQPRLRYFCLAYHGDSALFPFVDQLGEKVRSFFGHAPSCRTKIWRSWPIGCHWISQPQVDHWSRGELDFTRDWRRIIVNLE